MKKVMETVKTMWSDEQGAEGLEKLLIIAAIVLPLLGLLIFFRQDITDWVTEVFEAAKDDSVDYEFHPGN